MRATLVAACVTITLAVLSGCEKHANTSSVLPVVTLTPVGKRQLSPSYSPDGSRIAYWAAAGDSTPNLQLWVANADMSAPKSFPAHTVSPSLPIWSPDGSRLAVDANDFGVSDVVVVSLSGGEATRVTHGVGYETPIFWYPDGDRIAHYGTAAGGTVAVFVVSLRTGVSTALVPKETRPYLGSPSPDGSHIGYFVIDGPKATVWVADSVGENRRQLTTEGFEVLEQYHEWSPDGKELLYRSDRTGKTDLWIVPIDGGKPRQLTRDVRNDSKGVWSPDGKWVAFISERGRQTDIWTVPSAGGEEVRLTDSPVEEQGPLAWRNGSNMLTFQERELASSVWLKSLVDGRERQLTPDSLRVTFFNNSPDGTQLDIVIARGGGVEELAIVPMAGGTPRIVVSGNGTVVQPRWSPDGKQIVFQSDRGGTSDIWIVDAAGGAPRQLVNWPGFESNAMWSKDGSFVFFLSDRDATFTDMWKVPASGGEPVRVTKNAKVMNFSSRTGTAGLLAGVLLSSGGQVGLVRVDENGRIQSIWDKTNVAGWALSPSGDSVAALVEQPGGKMRTMVLAADGTGARMLLRDGEEIVDWSPDGRSILYTLISNGATDLALLDHRDGTVRRLTTTPEDEFGTEFTSDGKSIVFRRSKSMQRISRVDASSVLKGK